MNAFIELPTAQLIEKMSNEDYHARPEYSSSQLKERAFKILCQPNWLEFNYIIEPAFKVNR